MQKGFIKNKYIVILLSLIVLFLPVFWVENHMLNVTGGVLVYPLDDTYIHMSIAKHLAQNNVWGINSNEFSSASSSILYTLILAALFKIFSAQTIIPFVVNAITAIILLVVIQKRLQKENLSFDAQLIILIAAIVFTPLSAMVISGMEHTLQCLFSFVLIFGFSDWISQQNNESFHQQKLPVSLYVFAMLSCAIRFEGLFIIAIICCILLWKRKIAAAFLFGAIAVLPIVIFGIFSIMKGSYFLPNSVLLKSSPVQSSAGGFSNFISDVLINKLTISTNGITSLATQRLLLILPVTYLAFKKFITNSSYSYTIFILTICTLLQLSFASTGWFYRYEAYLVLSTIIIVAIVVSKYWKSFTTEFTKGLQLVALFVTVILFFPLILRSAAAYTKASQACTNIYEQQYQMGSFLKKYYNTDTVAMNDIGAASFFMNGKIVDLWGLADFDVAKSKKNHTSTPEFLNNHANEKNVKIAVVYDSWFDSSLLHHWQKVATWQIKNNVICGDSIVSFYAVQHEAIPSLKTNLNNYKNSLPSDVTVEYY